LIGGIVEQAIGVAVKAAIVHLLPGHLQGAFDVAARGNRQRPREALILDDQRSIGGERLLALQDLSVNRETPHSLLSLELVAGGDRSGAVDVSIKIDLGRRDFINCQSHRLGSRTAEGELGVTHAAQELGGHFKLRRLLLAGGQRAQGRVFVVGAGRGNQVAAFAFGIDHQGQQPGQGRDHKSSSSQ